LNTIRLIIFSSCIPFFWTMIQYAINRSTLLYFDGCTIANTPTQVPLSQCIACNQENNQIVYIEPWYWLVIAYITAFALIIIVYGLLMNILSRRAIALKLLPYGIYVTHLKGGKKLWITTYVLLCVYLIYIGKKSN